MNGVVSLPVPDPPAPQAPSQPRQATPAQMPRPTSIDGVSRPTTRLGDGYRHESVSSSETVSKTDPYNLVNMPDSLVFADVDNRFLDKVNRPEDFNAQN